MGNSLPQLAENPDSGNPQTAHDPLPVLQELEREATLNPLRANVVLERLSSAPDTSKSKSETSENEGETPTNDPKQNDDPEKSSLQEHKQEEEKNDVSQEKGTPDSPDGCRDDKGAEQLMRVAVPIPPEFCHRLTLSSRQRCHVILVADCSGSMAGNPWNQVKGALVDIVSTSLQNRGIVVDILTYNKEAKQVQFTPRNYSAILLALVASGTTSFEAAMNKVDQVMKEEKGQDFSSTAIMFMTDGQDTVSSAAKVRERMEKWKITLQASRHEVTTHAVGFSKGHDFEFLRDLTQVGTKPGLFRYCEPGDGPEVLKVKMEELFDYAIYSAGQSLDVTVEMNGKNRILGAGTLMSSHTMQGEIIHSNQAASNDDAQTGTGEITVHAEMWVWVPNVTELPAPTISLSKTVVSNGESHTVKLPCRYTGVEEKIIDNPADKAVWGLNILSRNTDVLATKIANAIQEKKDVTVLQNRLTRLQGRLSNSKVFGSRISKDVRSSLLSTMRAIQTKNQPGCPRISAIYYEGYTDQESIRIDVRESLLLTMRAIQKKMDTMHSMLAQYSRGETASVSILARAHDLRYEAQVMMRIMMIFYRYLARAHDLRYEAQFKKSRRQRLMDTRAVKNVRQAKADDAKLEQLTVDEVEIAGLSQEAVGFFFCALSQDSVVDILRDVDNKENAVGFGLAVCRPEYIVDNPTSLQLCLVSGTLVSRSAMLDALEFKVNLAGQLAAHNGFNFQQGNLGYATVGMGREPINAWLPLYVSPSHWNRVKMLMKPTLGYLCTLDPLGFDWAQLDVPFAILGAMIGQLNEATVGTHQLRLLLCFLRTCVACVDEFNLTDRILNIVRTFLQEPAGRLKNVIPNLFTLIGYIAALPVAQSRKILGYEEEGRDPDQFPRALWHAFVAEILRRSGGSLFKPYSDRERNTLLDLLLHGRKNSLMIPSNNTATQTANLATAKVQAATCTATMTTATTTTTPTPESSSSATADTPTTPTTTTTPTSQPTSESTRKSLDVSSSSKSTAEEEEASQAASDLSQHTSARFTSLCVSMTRLSAADLTIQGVDGEQESKGEQSGSQAKAEAAKPVVEFSHCPKMDSSMEIWARSQLSGLENKSQEKKVSSSKKQVEQWLKEGRQLAGLPEEDDTKEQEEEVFDCDAVDSSVLEVTAKLLSRLSKCGGFPLSSVPGAIAFLHAWMSTDRDVSAMSDGLPPAQWIDDIKAAIARVYSVMHDYVAHCQQEVASDDIEEVIIIEGTGQTSGGHGHHRGKRVDNDASDDDDDDDDYSDLDDYGLDEDDPMKVLKRRQQEHRSLVTLPMILHALDPGENKVKVTRAMLCQAVIHHSNAAAKEAVNEGQFMDLKNLDCMEELMTKLHRHLVRVCDTDQTDSILWQRANLYLMASTNIWGFLGYLMNTYTYRDEGFSWLLTEITDLGEGSAVPCLADKVRVMLTGQWQDHKIIDRGNSCMPGQAMSKKLMKVLGEDDWLQIDLDLRGDLKIHVYRESDIPNRHGHCNSNPYIPPALRLKLGMPPLASGK
ncbi:hypothetical protein ACOMHN_044886 [Nucella lapillus]